MNKFMFVLVVILFFSMNLFAFNSNNNTHNSIYIQLNCSSILSKNDLILLHSKGINNIEFVEKNIYFGEYVGNEDIFKINILPNIAKIDSQKVEYKCQPSLLENEVPSWAIIEKGKLKVLIRWQQNTDISNAKSVLKEKYQIDFSVEKKMSEKHSIAWINFNQINTIANENNIRYISVATQNDVPLNYVSQSMMSCGNASFTSDFGGRNLKGDSLFVGIGDESDAQLHADLVDRLINFNPVGVIGGHGHHTAGTMAGAGNIQPKYRGILPKSTIITNEYSNILFNTPLYKSLFNMVLTNNSYGAVVGDCNYEGVYDDLAKSTDELILAYPEVNHVFAAGNEGGLSCTNYGKGQSTILGGYQSSKNATIVGNILMTDIINASSSQGPTKIDLRLKPDVVAYGNAVISTIPNDTYATAYGTSMSSPAVAGVIGLIVQRFKQLHSNTLPQSDLVKALLLNGAYDIGVKGPDCTFGYGRVSANRSIIMLEKNNFIIDSLSNNDSLVYIMAINNPTTLSKFLMYYHDVPSNPFCSSCLINDLDFYIIDPNGNTHLPYVINTTDSNSIRQPAIHLKDSINNTEQIEINYGAIGNYKLVIKGKNIVNGKQRFVVTFDTLQPSVVLRSPIGSEKLISGGTEYIFWDKYDTSIVTYNLSYSVDSGNNWISIAQNISDSIHSFAWTPPSAGPGGLKIKIETSNGHIDQSKIFSSMPLAALSISAASSQCPTFCRVVWAAIPGATDYLLLQKIGKYMQVVDSTTALNYIFKNLAPNTKYYFAVQPRKGTLLGQQSNAKWYTPNIGTCTLASYNYDLKIDTLLFPTVARKFTKNEFTATENIIIVYSNQGNSAANNFTISYSVGNNPIVSQNFTTSLLAHSKDTFFIPYDLSISQNYPLTISITNNGNIDPNPYNDTLKTVIRHIANDPINLANTFFDGFETIIDTNVSNKNGQAINGIERWDFKSDSVIGRLRSKVLNGFAKSGSNAITLDANLNKYYINKNQFSGTFNFSNYKIDTSDIRFDFFYKHHNVYTDTNENAVFIRGNDTSSWINIYDLQYNQPNNPGEFKEVKSLNLKKYLKQNNQDYSSSTQIKFTQSGISKCVGNEAFNGYTFDDIKFYTVKNDVSLVNIEPIAIRSCGLNTATPIKINIENTSKNIINNVTVAYKIDGGSYTIENISALAADTTIQYSFNKLADLSALGNHTISAYIFHSLDSYNSNDSILNFPVFNSPLINSFPYLENFETNNGYFYSDGINNSWQHGTPNQFTKINRAASGNNVWKTNLNGNYKTNEKSYLYTPCFDIANLQNPMLSFSLVYQIENCGNTLCDGTYIDFSYDGINWKRLDYDTSAIVKSWYSDTLFAVWNGENINWKSYSFPLPKDSLGNSIQLRFVMKSDGGLNKEGVAIDDIHIYDYLNPIYSYSINPPTKIQTISTNNLYDFIYGNKIYASLKGNEKDILTNCKVNLFVNNDTLRFPNNNYHIDRNITVKSESKNTQDSVLVRLYFTQNDVDKIINDTICSSCKKPRDAYDLGMTKFSSIYDSIENGTMNDNTLGLWIYKKDAPIIPYYNGYYTEMLVKNFSEFWINYTPDTNILATLTIKDFTAKNNNNKTALLNWNVYNELNNHHFEIERATGNSNYENNIYQKINVVNSMGNNYINSYSYEDNTIPNFNEVYYYRLKWINNAGEFGYTESLPVVFGNTMAWLIYPNPSANPFFQFQIDNGQKISLFITDMSGKMITQNVYSGTGFIDKVKLNLESLASGVYIIRILNNNRTEQFRWIKN